MAEIKICRIKLRRLGTAEHEIAEIQFTTRAPAYGEVIDVPINRKSIRAKVVHVYAPPPGKAGVYGIDVDEVAN
jgi:hypothetical protein